MYGRLMDLEMTPLRRLRSEMNRLFEDFFEETPMLRPYGVGYPALNTWDEGEAACVEAELPGMSLENIEVLVSGNELTIKGERKIEEPSGATWRRRERSEGWFERTLMLPWDINADKVEAKLHDGVLTIRLPKAESAKARKIKLLT